MFDRCLLAVGMVFLVMKKPTIPHWKQPAKITKLSFQRNHTRRLNKLFEVGTHGEPVGVTKEALQGHHQVGGGQFRVGQQRAVEDGFGVEFAFAGLLVLIVRALPGLEWRVLVDGQDLVIGERKFDGHGAPRSFRFDWSIVT